jgi:hypothetical protein
MARERRTSAAEAARWTFGDGETPLDGTLDAYLGRIGSMLQALETASEAVNPEGDDLTGAVLRFPAADGYAVYRVVKHRPLTLEHVPYGDAWRIPAAHLRGLTHDDVRDQLRRNRKWKKLASRWP